MISAFPNAPYTVGAVPAVIDLPDTGTAVGWSLIVVYTNPGIPTLRDVNLFVGNEAVGAGLNGPVENIAGFKVPTGGAVSGHISISTLEGDSNKGGDQFRFLGSAAPVTTLSGANALFGPNNQVGNFFASQINYGNPPDAGLAASPAGALNPTGTFGSLNQPVNGLAGGRRQGWDVTNVDASAQLHNGDTNAGFQGTTSGDAYVITVTGVQIDVFQPTLQITKSSNGPWAPGQTAPAPTYTLDVTNAGTAPTVGTSTVLDQLPAGITANTAGPPFTAPENGWTCTVSATQLLTCSHAAAIPQTTPGNAVPFTVPVIVGAAAAGTLTNYASSGGGGDPSNGGAPPAPGPGCADQTHCANVPTEILTRDAQVIKSVQLTTNADGNGVPSPGDTLTWTVALSNTGTAPLTNAQITDLLPLNTTIVPGSAAVVSQTGTTPAAQANPAFNGAADQNLLLGPGATIAPRGNIVATFRVTINAGFHGILNNQAIGEGTGLTPARSSAADSATTGLPPGITVPTGSLPQGPDFTPNTGPPVPGPTRVNVVTPELTLLKSVAVTTDIVGNGAPNPGDTLRWTISYANTGSAPLPAAQIADTLPANTTFVPGSVAIVSETGTTPTATANGAFNGTTNTNLIGNTVTVATGGVITVAFSATINAGFTGTLANRATGTGSGLPPTGVPSRATDNTTTGIPSGVIVPANSIPQGPGGTDNLGEPINRETLVIVTPPSIALIKSVQLTTDADGNGVPSPGDTLTWRVALANNGTMVVPTAQITDALPANTAYVPGSAAIVSTTGTVPPATANPAFNGVGVRTLLATPVRLARNGVVIVAFRTTINAGFTGRLSNTATATGGGLPPTGVDSSAADATTTLPAGVTIPTGSIPQGADGTPNTGPPIPGPTTATVVAPTENFFKSVQLTTDADGNGAPTPGDTLTYTITGENSGSAPIPAAQISDTLPANTTIVAGSARVVSQSGTTPAATANAAFNGTTVLPLIGNAISLAPAGVITVTFQVTINAGFSGTLDNRAIATGGGLPPGGVPSAAVDNTTTGLDVPVPAGSIPQGPGGTPNTGPPISGPTAVIVTPPTAAVIKSVQLTNDADGNGAPSPGDTLTWRVALANTGTVAIPAAQLTDPLPANTAIVAGSAAIVSQNLATPAAAANTAFNGAANSTLIGNVVRLAPGGNIVVTFQTTINAGFTGTLTNLATATGNGLPPAGITSSAADGTTTGLPPGITVPTGSIPQGPGGTPNTGSPIPGPTRVIVVAPAATVIKSVRLLTDADGNGLPSPGDTISWTISYANTGTIPIPGSEITDTLPANTTLVAGSASVVGANLASPVPTGNPGFTGAPGGTNLTAAAFSLAPGGVVTVAYNVTINGGTTATLLDRAAVTGNGLPAGGALSSAADNATTGLPAGVVVPPTSLPQGPGGLPNAGPPIVGPTRVPVVTPNAFGIKTVQLTTDADGNGVVSPGDTLTWTMAYENTGTAPLPGTQITDTLPTNSAIVAGSATVVSSTGITGTPPAANTAFDGAAIKTLLLNAVTLAPGGTLVVSFRATINAGATTAATDRSVLNGNGLPPAGIPSFAADNATTGIPTGLVVPARSLPQGPGGAPNAGPPLNQATSATPVTPAATVVKSVRLTTDADNNGVPSPGDTLTWTVSYANTGLAPLPSAQINDAPGAGLTVVPGSAALVSETGAAPGVVPNAAYNGTTANSLVSDVVGLAPGGQITLSFRTTINAGATGTLNNSATGTARGLPPGGVPSAAADSTTTGLPPLVVIPPDSVPQGPGGGGNTGPPIPGPTHVTIVPTTAVGIKSVQLTGDADGNGVVSPGDTLTWTITYANNSTVRIPNAQITDAPLDVNTTLVAGSARVVAQTGVTPVAAANGAFNGNANGNLLAAPVTIAPGGVITVEFSVKVNPGATTPLRNRALLNGTGLPAAGVPTDAADNATTGLPAGVTVPTGSLPQGPGGQPNGGPPLNAPTFATPVAPAASVVKSVKLTTDVNGTGVPSPGDTLTWTVSYANTGTATIPAAQLTDATASNLTVVAGSASIAAQSGATPAAIANAAYNGTTNTTLIGNTVALAPSGVITVSFRTTINAGTTGTLNNSATGTGRGLPPAGVPSAAADSSTTGLAPDVVIPPGSIPQGPNGAPNTGPPIPGPTHVTEIPTTAAGIKSVQLTTDADGNGVLTPGDTLTWTITYVNTSTVAIPKSQVTDTVDSNTSLVKGSETVVASTGVSPAPAANAGFDGNAVKNLLVAPVTIAPNGSITVSFRATLNAGATSQVTNRAVLNGTGLPAAGIPTSAADNSTTGLPPGVVIPPGSLPQGPGGKPNAGPPLAAPTFAVPQAISAAGVKSAAITGGPSTTHGGAPGDVVTWTIAYANTGAAPIANAQITDTLPLNTTFVRNSVTIASTGGVTPAPGANGAYDGALAKNLLAAPVTLARGALIVVRFSVTINPGFTGTISNRAVLNGNGLPAAGIPTGAADPSTTGLPPGFTVPGGSQPQGPNGAPNSGAPVNGATVVNSVAPALSPLLVQKTVDRPVAASGDRLIYTIVVNNPNAIALGLTKIVDELPGGVAYANGSTRIDGSPVPDPLRAGSTLTWSVPATAPKGEHTVIFAAVIAPGIPVDTVLTNTANANAKVPGTTTTLVSGNAQAQTRVIGGIFNNCVTIVGRVFTNRDDSGRFGRDDVGIPGVRVYTETGQYVVTDRYGKYDFPCIRPGMHVLRLDTTTLPPGTAPYNVRNYDDPRSVIRLAHGTLDAGLIQNINFAIRGAP